MVLVSAIPGTSASSPNDGFPSIAQIKQTAKQSLSSYRGATAINLLGTARKAFDAGIMKEDAGDLHEALLKYYIGANILHHVMSTQEYKLEDAPGKHGAVYQQTRLLSDYFTKTATPRLQAVEARLREIEASRATVIAGLVGASTAPNGTHPTSSPSKQQTADEDAPNEKSGGSILDRMRKLQGAGLDTTVAKPASTSKRLSHQSIPSVSSLSSLQAPMTPRSHVGINHNPAPSLPESSTIVTPMAPPSGNTAYATSPPSPRYQSEDSPGQSASTHQSPLPAPLSPPISATSPSYSTTSFSGLGPSPSPSPSPHLKTTEIRRHGTGGSGMSSSPRHRNLQSLSGSPLPPDVSPRRRSITLDASTPNAQEAAAPPTPSLSQFKSTFPPIEDWNETFESTDALPSVPEHQLPLFPSVPKSPVGANVSRSSSSQPPDKRESWRSQPDTSDFSASARPSRPPSMSSVPLRVQHSGTSANGFRSPSATSSTPSLNPLTSGSRPHRTSISHGKKPVIPTTNGIDPKSLRSFLDNETNGGLQVLLLDVRSRDRYVKERIDTVNSVCIEPTVLLRTEITALGIESSLVLSPRTEETMFRNREKFDLVVIYDESSTVFVPVLLTLNRLIYQAEAVKTLQRPPMMLIGGLKRWKQDLGTTGLVGTHVGDIGSKSPETTNGRPTSDTGGRSNGNGTPVSVNGFNATAEVRSRDGAAVYGEEREKHRKAHVRDGAVFEPSSTPPTKPAVVSATKPKPATEKPDTTANDLSERSLRKSTLVRPSSSGTISAYNRPLLDTQVDGGLYANHVPISYPSRALSQPTTNTTAPPPTSFSSPSAYLSTLPAPPAVAPPPQASLSGSPLARRRSDYAEQSLFAYSGFSPGTSRASIDYPALSAQHVVRPPPPAASNAMERQEQRPRGHAPSFSAVQTPSNVMTVVAGVSIPTPPTIPSNYSVIYWSDTQIGMSGLRNLGNTCYMNSIVQCLSATVPFARFFIDGRWKSAVNMRNPLGTNGAVAHAFAKIVHDLWQGESTYLSPYGFRKSICGFAPQFGGSDQHDAQEFLSFLLDGLHEDLNRIIRKPSIPSPTPERERDLETLPQQIAGAQEWQLYRLRDDSLVVDYFQGQFRNRLTCLTCKHTSTTYNSFMYLSLPIPTGRGVSKVTLDACLQAFVEPEVMEKSDAWNCPNCKTLRKATKQLSLSRMPPVLLIHLKRFSFKGPFTDKLETMVDFPVKDLDLTNYMPPLLHPNDDKTGMYGQRAYGPDDPRIQAPPYKYDLFGVTNHFGSLSSGHYTSFIASKGGWVYCDDSRLTTADPRDVVGRPAYILFYRRVRTS